MEERQLFEKIGAEQGVRRLVDAFYDYMASLPEARGILELHPPDLRESRDKLYKFLVGWAGGPPLYVQEYGHPRLRARHLPFPIGESERDQWMLCMRKALEDCNTDKEARDFLDEKFTSIADVMRNKQEEMGALQRFVDPNPGSKSD